MNAPPTVRTTRISFRHLKDEGGEGCVCVYCSSHVYQLSTPHFTACQGALSWQPKTDVNQMPSCGRTNKVRHACKRTHTHIHILSLILLHTHRHTHTEVFPSTPVSCVYPCILEEPILHTALHYNHYWANCPNSPFRSQGFHQSASGLFQADEW